MESLDLDLVFPVAEAEKTGEEVVGGGGGGGEGEEALAESNERVLEEKPTFDFERLVLCFEMFYQQDPNTIHSLAKMRYFSDMYHVSCGIG